MGEVRFGEIYRGSGIGARVQHRGKELTVRIADIFRHNKSGLPETFLDDIVLARAGNAEALKRLQGNPFLDAIKGCEASFAQLREIAERLKSEGKAADTPAIETIGELINRTEGFLRQYEPDKVPPRKEGQQIDAREIHAYSYMVWLLKDRQPALEQPTNEIMRQMERYLAKYHKVEPFYPNLGASFDFQRDRNHAEVAPKCNPATKSSYRISRILWPGYRSLENQEVVFKARVEIE